MARHAHDGGPALQLEVDLDHEAGRTPERLHPDVEIAIYRIAQEALRNALKHAQAHTVAIAVAEIDGEVGVRIRDDGRVPSKVSATGFGLVSIQERVELLDGRLRGSAPPRAKAPPSRRASPRAIASGARPRPPAEDARQVRSDPVNVADAKRHRARQAQYMALPVPARVGPDIPVRSAVQVRPDRLRSQRLPLRAGRGGAAGHAARRARRHTHLRRRGGCLGREHGRPGLARWSARGGRGRGRARHCSRRRHRGEHHDRVRPGRQRRNLGGRPRRRPAGGRRPWPSADRPQLSCTGPRGARASGARLSRRGPGCDPGRGGPPGRGRSGPRSRSP